MKSVAVLYTLLGLTTLRVVNGQSLLTIYDADTSTVSPTGLPDGADLDYYVKIGEANGETTYLENEVKSIYTSGTTTTFTTSPTTASGTLVVSASGFRYIHSQVLPDQGFPIVGQGACTIDGKGGAGCSAELAAIDGTETLTVITTGLARPNILTVSPSPTSTGPGGVNTTPQPTGSTTTPGQQPSPTHGGALGLRAGNSRPLVWALTGLSIGVWAAL